MQDLIRPDASFTPRELFSRTQGAWLEPRLGSMWQENTGVTPTTTGGQTVGKLVDLTAARVASQSTAANRPVFGVRRNLLTYSEDFSNAAYAVLGTASKTPNYATAPDGTLTACRVQGAGSLYGHGLYTGAITRQIWVKSNAGAPQQFGFGGSGIYTATTNWQLFVDSVNAFAYLFHIVVDNVDISIWHPQTEYGSTATDYQRVTTATDYDAGRFPAIRHADATDVLTASLPDLGGGVFSSAASVYFSTPSGMSCLHNQSIGTSYNLPAQQTDIYGTVITPARLAPPLEQRLALYMHRLAGLADADFFWQEQATDGMTGQLLTDDNDTILLRG